MSQSEARAQAKAQSTGGRIFVATTVCAARGQFETGADAGKWIVVRWTS